MQDLSKGKKVIQRIREKSRIDYQRLAAIKNNGEFCKWIAEIPETEVMSPAELIALGMFLGMEMEASRTMLEQLSDIASGPSIATDDAQEALMDAIGRIKNEQETI
jgi:hypothetical protein